MAINTTPAHGLPWPDSAEAVTNGWDAIRDLAVAVDGELTERDTAIAGKMPRSHDDSHTRLIAVSGGIQDDGGVQIYLATGQTWTEGFICQTFTKDGFGNYVPTPVPKAITHTNGTIYWSNGQLALGTIVYARIIDLANLGA